MVSLSWPQCCLCWPQQATKLFSHEIEVVSKRQYACFTPYIYIYIYTYIYTCISFVSICVHVCACVCVCIYIYIYICYATHRHFKERYRALASRYCRLSLSRILALAIRLGSSNHSVPHTGGRSWGGCNQGVVLNLVSRWFWLIGSGFGRVLRWPLQLRPPLRSTYSA